MRWRTFCSDHVWTIADKPQRRHRRHPLGLLADNTGNTGPVPGLRKPPTPPSRPSFLADTGEPVLRGPNLHRRRVPERLALARRNPRGGRFWAAFPALRVAAPEPRRHRPLRLRRRPRTLCSNIESARLADLPTLGARGVGLAVTRLRERTRRSPKTAVPLERGDARGPDP